MGKPSKSIDLTRTLKNGCRCGTGKREEKESGARFEGLPAAVESLAQVVRMDGEQTLFLCFSVPPFTRMVFCVPSVHPET